ncbi:hypothetical protein HAX54_010313 [Datura stramonium]|uniref:Uncharacterized protein n=1 Tax=Datura stramonium TaxID=4076 RepID=A0ABS8TG03_DATST|nr:hypothetical protein [Datura stramonium]
MAGQIVMSVANMWSDIENGAFRRASYESVPLSKTSVMENSFTVCSSNICAVTSGSCQMPLGSNGVNSVNLFLDVIETYTVLGHKLFNSGGVVCMISDCSLPVWN